MAPGPLVEMALYSAVDHLRPRKTPPLWSMDYLLTGLPFPLGPDTSMTNQNSH